METPLMSPAASYQHELEFSERFGSQLKIDLRDPLETSRKPPGHPLDLLDTLSKPLGGLLEASWTLLDAFRKPLGGLLEPLGDLLDTSRSPLGRSRSFLGRSWSLLGHSWQPWSAHESS